MSFGLCNASATFERLMESVLRNLQWKICLIYIDDVIVFGKDFQETLKNLEQVLIRFRDAGLMLKPTKCELFRSQVNFLGHVATREGVICDPEKIEKVVHWPAPSGLKELQSFLGFTNYYRRFVKNYSELVSPLTKLTRKNVTYVWDEQCQRAFQHLKDYFTGAPLLAYPLVDGGIFILDTDASGDAIGAVLSQVQQGEERVIAYASSTLEPSRKRYCSTYRELYAVVKFIKHFRVYLLGRHFVVRTDHASLRWLLHFRDLESGMLARWLSTLSEYDFELQHRPGSQHGNADGLSRMPGTRRCKRADCPVCSLDVRISVLRPESNRSSFVGLNSLSQPTSSDAKPCNSPGPQAWPACVTGGARSKTKCAKGILLVASTILTNPVVDTQHLVRESSVLIEDNISRYG